MNRRIRICHAIAYMVFFYAAAACFLLGPCGVLKRDRLVAGSETVRGTAQVRLDQQIQQVFIAEGTYLRYLDLYVTSADSAGEVYHLFLYDEHNQQLINRDVTMPETKLPGFLRIPLGVETMPQTAYVWQLQARDVPMDLAFENTGETGLFTFGNYYVLYDGQTRMQEAQNIVMRLTYTDSPSAGRMGFLYSLCLLTAAVLAGAALWRGRSGGKLSETVSWQRAIQMTAGPVGLVFTAFLLYAVYCRDLFGGKTDDKIVYGAGIVIAAAFFSWVLFGKRPPQNATSLRRVAALKGMDWLQEICFAGVLMGTIHFMNAQFQLQQDLAYREVLFWACLVLLTMGSARAFLNRRGAVWLAVSSLGGIAWYLYCRFGRTDAGERLPQIKYEILIAIAAGFVLLSLIGKIRSRQFAWHKLNRFYAGALFLLLFLLVLFRNTRGWPVYLAVYFSLFYVFYIGWEGRERLLGNFCGGVTLNFALAVIFALARRPFRAWVYSRYNFVFHTVTITAYYLTLVLCALTVRLLIGLYRDGRHPIRIWGTLLLYGMAASFLFLTLSRTGYLAVIVMTAVVVPFAVLWCFRQRIRDLIRDILVMGAIALLCLPVTYTGIRILPALYNDPYIYEVEESAAAIHRDDPKDSNAYMSVSYFKYVLENKLLADASILEETGEFLQCLGDTLYVEPTSVLVAADGDAGLSDVEEFSNGRMEIFRRYIGAWNLFGHDEMGVELGDGSVSVHAHNTYLQVIHDHGLLVGVCYLLFGALSAGSMFLFAYRNGKKDGYAILPLAVFLGFAVAGLVEWLFHPCNPMGFSVMVVFAPLLFTGREKRIRK